MPTPSGSWASRSSRTPEQTYEGIDLLDPTKLVPEEIAPVQPIGRLVLDRNPSNYFAETEQVAFHVGNLVPGIDVTDDALMQARLFSYVDTQLTRLGGPNFNQIPVNRPHAPVNDMLRDGFHQDEVHHGVAPYHPNSLDGGCPFLAGDPQGAFLDNPVTVPETSKQRTQPASFDDHFSQARLFWLSMTPVEKQHIVAAYAFELGKVHEQEIRERQLQCLAEIAPDLCGGVATALGLPAPSPTSELADPEPSPALSMLGGSYPPDGRVVGVLVGPDSAADEVDGLRTALLGSRMMPLLVAPTAAPLDGELAVQRTFSTARSVEFDALVVADGAATVASDPHVMLLVEEIFRHGKALLAWGNGAEVIATAGIAVPAPGVKAEESASTAAAELPDLLAAHRAWERFALS